MNDLETVKQGKHTVTAQLRGETIAYAVQHGVYNLAANFIEPYLNYRTQKYYSEHDAAPLDKDAPQSKDNAPRAPTHGTYVQNLAGEFAGDIIGSSSLILAEALFPSQLHAFTRKARSWVDPLYTSVAHRVFAKEKDEPDYEQKIEKWKIFQERNLVRSMIMAAAGIAGNVATQKLLIGNPSPASVIFRGKLLSAALTTTAGLASRFALPDQMRRMDRWLGKNIFTPMLEDKEMQSDDAPTSHADRLSSQKNSHTLAPAR